MWIDGGHCMGQVALKLRRLLSSSQAEARDRIYQSWASQRGAEQHR